ncbi:MAG TPA: hypothetical protein VE093_13485 [Polyangiaceae bacterium]|jgi:hypothetical protein|nr:hypothetical protein [Polyangiaceae bacterium]
MANRPLRPGLGQSGFAAVLEVGFNVPTVPTILRAEAAERVRRKIEAERIPCQRLDLSNEPVSRGSLFDMTGVRVLFPEGDTFDVCYVALIDPNVASQWGHAAFWAFVPSNGQGDTALRSTNFPENAKGSVTFSQVLL